MGAEPTSIPGVLLVARQVRSVYSSTNYNMHRQWSCHAPDGPCYADGLPCPCMRHLVGHDHGDEDRSE